MPATNFALNVYGSVFNTHLFRSVPHLVQFEARLFRKVVIPGQQWWAWERPCFMKTECPTWILASKLCALLICQVELSIRNVKLRKYNNMCTPRYWQGSSCCANGDMHVQRTLGTCSARWIARHHSSWRSKNGHPQRSGRAHWSRGEDSVSCYRLACFAFWEGHDASKKVVLS